MSMQRENELYEEVERLKAELARLTPSGQVAEDEAMLTAWLRDGIDPENKRHAALPRLAAQDQGYEAIKGERDAANARAASLEAECARHQMEKAAALGERDAAVASSAALLKGLRRARAEAAALRDTDNPKARRASAERSVAAMDALLLADHPSAALLAEHAKALVRARNEGLEKAATEANDHGHRIAKDGGLLGSQQGTNGDGDCDRHPRRKP